MICVHKLTSVTPFSVSHVRLARTFDALLLLLLLLARATGDDEDGHDYVTQIGTLKKDPMILEGQQRIPRTVSGYLDIYTSVGLPNNVDPRTFLFNVSKFNNQLPRNVSARRSPRARAHVSLSLGVLALRRHIAGIVVQSYGFEAQLEHYHSLR